MISPCPALKIAPGFRLGLLSMIGLMLLMISCLSSPTAQGQSATTQAANAADSPSVAASRPAFSHYRLIIDRNLFMRRPTSSSGGRSANQGVASASGSSESHDWILTGIAITPDGPIAFIEQTKTGQTTLARPGQSLDFGLVESVEQEHLTIRLNQNLQTVAIGQALDGTSPPNLFSTPPVAASISNGSSQESPEPPPPGPTPLDGQAVPTLPPPPSSAAASPSPSSDNDKPNEADVIARLRAKRQQEKTGSSNR